MIAPSKMVMQKSEMVISVTEFKARCLEILRDLERNGQAVEIVRRGRVIARVIPIVGAEIPPAQRLRGTGRLLAGPEDSVLDDADFEANR